MSDYRVPHCLNKAKTTLILLAPYMARVVSNLRPRRCNQVPWMAVDRWWRWYINEEACERRSLEDNVLAIYHECMHLMCNHFERTPVHVPEKIANEAGDLAINSSFKRLCEAFNKQAEKIPRREGTYISLKLETPFTPPKNILYPETLGFPPNLIFEQYIDLLMEQAQNKPKPPPPAPTPNFGKTPKGEDDGGEGDGLKSGSDQGGEQGEQSSSPGSAGSQDPGGETEDELEGESEQDSEEEGQQTESKDSGKESDKKKPSSGGNGKGDKEEDGQCDGQVMAGSCGSCAGRSLPFEEPDPTGSACNDAVSEAQAGLVLDRVAQDLQKFAGSGRGVIPGDLRILLESKAKPTPRSWQSILTGYIRESIGRARGLDDYSWRERSRHSTSKILLPGLYKPEPNLAIVWDTSGSMMGTEDTVASEIQSILRVCECGGAPVLCGDTEVQSAKRCFAGVDPIPVGGGGTDMRVLIEKASQLSPRPSVCIVVTDGYTPWPEHKIRGMALVVAIVRGTRNGVPEWAKVVEVTPE